MRTPGERIQETLVRYKEDEITRAEALAEILRVLRSICKNCRVRNELQEIMSQNNKQRILETIEGEF